MARTAFEIVGTVRTSGKQGVHGLEVEMFEARGDSAKVLDKTLTDSEGRFAFELLPDRERQLFEGNARISVRVRDRDGNIIHRFGQNRRVQPASRASFNIQLGDEEPSGPILRPTSGRDVPLELPLRRIGERIRQAIDHIPGAGPGDRDRLQGIFDCLQPPLGRFPDVLTDAIGVLDGDPLALVRFEDTLDSWAREEGARREPSRSLSTARQGGRLSREAIPKAQQRDRASAGTVIGAEQGLLLLAAAVEAAGGNRDRAYRNMDVVRGQLDRAQRLVGLDRAAAGTLGGSLREGRRLAGMIEGFDWLCDPRMPEPDEPGQWEPGVIDCMYGFADSLLPTQSYQINSVTPDNACSGDLITISGSGFGSGSTLNGLVASKVRFTRVPGDGQPAYVETDAEGWSDTLITVRVPVGATAGPMRLRIRDRTVRVCNWAGDLYRPGNNYEFLGGSSPVIVFFRMNGEDENVIVEPGTPLSLSWEVLNADQVRIRRVSDNGPPVDDTVDRPAQGNLDLGPFEASSPTFALYEIVTENDCGPSAAFARANVDTWPNLQIEGFEVIQAVQELVMGSLNDPFNNSVPLVARKRTIVRIYVESGISNGFDRGDGPNQQRISGAVRFRRAGTDDFFEALGPLNNGDVSNARPVADLRRGSWEHSLNFELTPFTELNGEVEIEARVWAGLQDPGEDIDSRLRDSHSQTVEFHPTRPITLVRLLVADGALGVAAPTVAQFNTAMSGVLRRFPIAEDGLSVGTVPGLGTITTTQDLTTRAGWSGLLNEIEAIADGVTPQGEIWAALVPNVAAYAVTGMARRPWNALLIDEKPKFAVMPNFPAAFAHEVIHTFWVGHPACPGATTTTGGACVANPDNRIPLTTDAVGVDVATRQVVQINTAEVMQQVCCGAGQDGTTSWVSTVTWNILFDALRI